MTSHLGQPMTGKDHVDQLMAMVFGFINCSDICPTTLLCMIEFLAKLGPEAEKLKVILVGVDSERDTAEIMKSYLEQFDPRFSAMTGTREQLAAFNNNYFFVYKKVPLNGGNPGAVHMHHSADVYLYDAKGAFVRTLDSYEDDKTALEKLLPLVC